MDSERPGLLGFGLVVLSRWMSCVAVVQEGLSRLRLRISSMAVCVCQVFLLFEALRVRSDAPVALKPRCVREHFGSVLDRALRQLVS